MLKSHFGMIVTLILALGMGIIMGLAAMIVDHLPMNVWVFYQNWGVIALNVIVISLFVPYKAWSARLTGKLGLQEGTAACTLVSNIIPSLIFNTVNTLLVPAAGIFTSEAIPAGQKAAVWASGAVRDWPIMFVISFLAALVCEQTGVRIAKKNDPSKFLMDNVPIFVFNK